jgi:hypothetical protein
VVHSGGFQQRRKAFLHAALLCPVVAHQFIHCLGGFACFHRILYLFNKLKHNLALLSPFIMLSLSQKD